MRMSSGFFPTLREDPAEARIQSHRLMLRAGLMRREAPGVYTLLPLGLRVVRKVADIIREEMDREGAQEISMPLLCSVEPWLTTGRWHDYGDEMFRLTDRNGRQFCLAPTHEETITGVVRDLLSSPKQLPVLLYHIGPKFRDEIRPRFGVMRSREFMMKDLYSFDTDVNGLEQSYRKMYGAYERVFSRCGLSFHAVEADSGAIGGSGSHEFVAFSDEGESTIVTCPDCGYAADVEKAECMPRARQEEAAREIERVATPGIHTIDEVAAFLGVPAAQTAKTLFYRVTFGLEQTQLVAAVLPGDRELNEWKLRSFLGATSVEKASPGEVMEATGAPFGSAGPVNLQGARILVDTGVAVMNNIVVGANEEGYHLLNVNPGRDFHFSEILDLTLVGGGDLCPRCGKTLQQTSGIEVGQLFKLYTKYSEALSCVFPDETGEMRPVVMGCYGIGVTRTVAAIIEQHHDVDGICWPVSVAPYHLVITCVNTRDEAQVATAAGLYARAQSARMEALLDDRDERAGVKFKDADLMGIPYRINAGRKAAQGIVELVCRATHETKEVAVDEVIALVQGLINECPTEQ